MTHCLNPDCPSPQNPDTGRFCQACGWRLRLGDRYRAVKPIGEGSSSQTFIGQDVRSKGSPTCLIKAFTPQGKNRRELKTAIDRLREEVVRLDRVSRHPQIPTLLAYFERDLYQYLVQEFIAGSTLEDQLRTQGTLNESQIREMLQNLLPVLQFLHEHQIVHRDIKPTNLIQPTGADFWVLADFGAAKALTPTTLARPGTLIGSAEYAAPEQLRGQATFASDLYSLGVTCLHLMTGLSPFDLFDSTTQRWIWRGVTVDISDRFAQLLDKLVHPQLSQRYQAASEVLADLSGGSNPQRGILSVPEQEPPAQAIQTLRHWHCVHVLAPPDDLTVQFQSLAWSPDNQTLAVGCSDHSIRLWDAESMVMSRTLTAHEAAVTALAYSPNGQFLASGSWDTTVRLWDLQNLNGETPTVFGNHAHALEVLGFCPDGQTLISGGRDRTLKFWRVLDGTLLQSFTDHENTINALAVSPDGETLASGDADGQIKIWHLPNRELLRTLAGESGAVSALALTMNPPLLISAGWDMMLKLRNPDTGGLLRTVMGHTLPIQAIAVHPEGRLFATGSHDQTIKLWSIPDGQWVTTLSHGEGTIDAIAFSSDGRRLASIGQARIIQIWQCIDA